MSAGWNEAPLGKILRIQNGYAFDSKNFSPEGEIPLIRIRDLRGGASTETKYTGLYDKAYEVRSGDFLIGMDGEFGCYEWRGKTALLNQRVCRLHKFSDELVPRFLFYGINKHLKDIEDVTTYTTVKHLSSKQIANIIFRYPSASEQRRIVAILDEAFEAIATATANAEKNLASAQGFFELLLRHTLSDSSWPKKRLADLANVQSGGTPSRAKSQYWGGDLPWYSSGELNEINTSASFEGITGLGLENSNAKVFPRGSLLVGMYDTAAMKMSILDRDAAFNQAIAGIQPNAGLEVEFLFYALSAIKSDVLEMRRGVRQKNLSLEKIKNIEIGLPDIGRQKELSGKIGHRSSLVISLKDAYRKKLIALAELRSTILRYAFAGQLTHSSDVSGAAAE